MISTSKYSRKPIDEARNDLIGTKVTDIEVKGQVIYLQNEEGRIFAIDNTGSNGAVVFAYAIDSEKLETLESLVNAIMTKLNIDEDELVNMLCDE